MSPNTHEHVISYTVDAYLCDEGGSDLCFAPTPVLNQGTTFSVFIKAEDNAQAFVVDILSCWLPNASSV